MGLDDAPPGWHDDPDRAGQNGREPPWSREAEQSVLGGLLIDNRALSLVGDLLGERAFYMADHQAIFGAISKLIGQQQPADAVTVLEALKDAGAEDIGSVYLMALSNSVPSASNIRRYAEIVHEKWSERMLIAAVDEQAGVAWNAQMSLDDRIERMAAAIAKVEQQRKNPGARIPLMRLPALRQAASGISWVVKHVLPADSIGILFGGSGTFKSFVAVDCALHIAHGLPWMGRRTNRGSVLYIAAEGGAGLWNRIDAWHRQRGMEWTDAELAVVPIPVDLAADAWRVVDAAQAQGVTPALVVVDTLSQTYAGDENSANEMAAYLRELGLRFRSLWNCAVLVIHHTGHNATERPRGSSAIRANVDFMFGVFRDEKEMLATLSCAKQKDGEMFRDAVFQLSVAELGLDDEGDSITSLVARHLGTEEQIAEARAREAEAGRGGRNQQLMDLVQNGMLEKELRRAFYESVVEGLDSEAKKKAFGRARAAAVNAGLIEIAEGFVIDLRKGQK